MNSKSIILWIITPLLLIALLPAPAKAQMRMTFCNRIDEDGNLSGCGNQFTFPPDGGHLRLVLLAPKGKTLNTQYIEYVIYKDSVYYATITDNNIGAGWRYCNKVVDFFFEGHYTITAYDMDRFNPQAEDYGILMARGSVTIKLQQHTEDQMLLGINR